MGAQVSEELDRWVSVSDLALTTTRMRIIPALPAECQVEILRVLWRSLHWVPRGEILVTPSEPCDRMYVVARGEAEVILSNTSYIPLLPEGTFVCEAALLGFGGQPNGVVRGLSATATGCSASAWGCPPPQPRQIPVVDPVWPLRRDKRFPSGPLSLISEFLRKQSTGGPRFQGKIRTTRRSLIATLTRQELLSVLHAKGSDAVRGLADMPATCNALQNVTAFGAEVQGVNVNDVAARVVCEGPMHASCQPVLRGVKQGLFGACMHPPVVE